MLRRLLLMAVLAAASCCFAVLADAAGCQCGGMISCETYSLRQLFDNKQITMETFPAKMKELGIPGIAINDWYLPSRHIGDLSRVKKAVKESGCVITALITGGNFATPDANARRRSIEEAKRNITTAAFLRAPVMRLDTGGVGQGEDSDTVGVERVTAAFKELVPYARARGVKLTIENHGGVSGKADNVLKIIKGTDPEWVGSCLDFKNWPREKIYEECAKLAPYAYHTHAKSHHFNEDGEEKDIEYKQILPMLRKAGYRGALSIEFEGGGDPVEGVAKTRDLILRYWPPCAGECGHGAEPTAGAPCAERGGRGT